MKQELSRILYAEDEPDIQAIVKILLEEIAGFDLKICASGKDAVEQFPEFKPQLILLDVMMPEMDGVEALKQIRALPAYDNQPFVFMTAKVQFSEVDEYRELGAADVIIKPFDPMGLADRILEIWEVEQSK